MNTDSFIVHAIIKILQKILKQGLILQIINWTDHCLQRKEVIELVKDELSGKIMK